MNSSVKTNNKLEFDVAIIGAGPAGLTCAIYLTRGNLSTCFIDKSAPGGKMTQSFSIQNWSGDQEIKGFELSMKMLNHAKSLGAKHIFGNVVNIETKNEFEHYIYLEQGKTIKAKSIVIATGMINKKPEIKNLDHFEHKGVSYCAICDAPLYKNKPAAIIGGGDSAFEEAIYLSSIASHVYIFVRKDKARAEAKMVSQVENNNKITVLYNSQVIELLGKDNLEKIIYLQNDEQKEMEINHLYPYIGLLPSNNFLSKNYQSIIDENGFIKTNENMETSIKGIYAIGDIRNKNIRQIITAANDGAIAGKTIVNKIRKN